MKMKLPGQIVNDFYAIHLMMSKRAILIFKGFVYILQSFLNNVTVKSWFGAIVGTKQP